MRFKQPLSLAATLVLLAGCSGGSSSPSALVPHTFPSSAPTQAAQAPTSTVPTTSSATADLTLSATLGQNGATQLLADAKRSDRKFTTLAELKKRLGYSISSVEVDGTITPGYAGTYLVTNTQTYPASNNSVSVTMTFSNVPLGNNEWAELDFYAKAADGSKFYLGSYTKIVSVAASNTSPITLSAASTANEQAMIQLLDAGLLDANDLATNTGLEASIASELASNNITVDPTTQELSSVSLSTFVNDVTPTYQRSLVISPPSGATEVTIVADPTSVPEANLHEWVYGDGLAGTPPGEYEPPALGSVGPVPVVSDGINNYNVAFNIGTTPLTISVYGGPIIVGATNDTAPNGSYAEPDYTTAYQGSFTNVGSRPAGSTTISLNALSNSQISIATSDPQDAAFGQTPNFSINDTTNSYDEFGLAGTIVGTYSPTNTNILVNSFNPEGFPLTDYTICAYQTCQPLSSSSTLSIQPPFYDNGSNLNYFGWAPANSSTSVSSNPGGGYVVDYSGLTSTITTSVPATIYPGSEYNLYFSNFSSNGNTNTTVPSGTCTLTYVDSSNQSHSASAPIGGYTGNVYLYLPTTTTITTTSISITLAFDSGSPTSGSYTLNYISADSYSVPNTQDVKRRAVIRKT